MSRRFAGTGSGALRSRSAMWGFRIRRAAALLLVGLLALPPALLVAAPNSIGIIEGTVVLEGRPLSGVTVAFIELDSGDVVRAVSGEDGSFEAQAAAGEYAVTTESQAGLAVGRAPVRVAVTAGAVARAEVELLSVPSALPQQEAPQTPPVETPPAGAPIGDPQVPAGWHAYRPAHRPESTRPSSSGTAIRNYTGARASCGRSRTSTVPSRRP